MNDTCSGALEYKKNVQLNIVLAIHVLISVGGVVTNVLFVRHWRRGLFFHKNSQVLIWTIVILNLLHSFLLGMGEGVHLFQHYVVQDTCNALVSTVFCYVVRMPTLMCAAAQALVHLSIVTERAIALKRIKTYEKRKSSIGLVLAVASVSISVGMAAYTFKNYPMFEKTSYCKVATSQTILQIIEFSCSVLFLEAVIIVSFCCVYCLNSKGRLSPSTHFYRQCCCGGA
ncbi:unnamed protein product [Cylicocyclus nassatus]|uniref:Uncharacterized protein n=1 Tax=Cylicocyclus nassatus TaxID=53992 RepID=A0AA36H4A1_CYLNA|nr:unnamed protein product [Cylicocyclus nassatus]